VITNSLFNGNTARNAVTSRGADIFVAGVPKSFSISNSYLQGPSSYNYTQQHITIGSGNWLNNYSTTTIPQGCPVNIDNSTLPVIYSRTLSATIMGKAVQLAWTTATEIDNNGFEIQRSVDGISFTKIGFLNSKAIDGNSTEQVGY